MEGATQVSPPTPGQPNQPLDSPRHELQSPSSNEDTQKRNRPESSQHESHVSAQSLKRSRNTTLAPPSFPQEIIAEVLSNLPVKSLLRFRCVSKSWKALVSDPFFTKKHLRNPKCPEKRVLINNHCIQSCSISSLFEDPIVNTKEIEYPSCFISSLFEDPIFNTKEIEYPSRNVSRCDWIVGSCDGLICIALRPDRILLINPILRVSKRLPDLGFKRRRGCYTVHGFGYDASTDDYKVVRAFCHRSKGFEGSYESIVRIFSLRTNYWRRIQDFPFGLPYNVNGKHVDGCLNWLIFRRQGVISSYTIVALDLARETYKEVVQPCYGDRLQTYKTLGILDGCLCVLSGHERLYTDVWVMKEYGKKESWSKLATIPYMQLPGYELLFSAPLFVSESGEILLLSGSDLIIYKPKEKSCRKPVFPHADISNIQQVEVYEESLVSPQLQSVNMDDEWC